MRRPRPCVRCGTRERGDDLFVCYPCATDPVKAHEIEEAQAATRHLIGSHKDRGLAQRAYLVKTFHWVGKWSSRK